MQSVPSPISPPHTPPSSSSSTNNNGLTRRRTIIFSASLVASYLHLSLNSIPSPLNSAIAAQDDDEIQQEEDRVVHLFEETSPSVVFIKDLEIVKTPKSSDEVVMIDDENAKVEGTGSGFIWDKFGHIVTNYHVITKLATDQSGLHRCKVILVDAKGNSISRDGKVIGVDPAYDLAVLKVDVEENELKPIILGTASSLKVGQSCFAIGNPYGYENTLTTGVVSGLGREIPSPNGGAIRGAIQTDAAINAGDASAIVTMKFGQTGQERNTFEEAATCCGSIKIKRDIFTFDTQRNSGGPLLDSYGHVIGVNTATFTRKGTGVSSGVNFAIPIDTVVPNCTFPDCVWNSL